MGGGKVGVRLGSGGRVNKVTVDKVAGVTLAGSGVMLGGRLLGVGVSADLGTQAATNIRRKVSIIQQTRAFSA